MRKFVLLAVTALAIAGVVPGHAGAVGDVNGPACADIFDGVGTYTTEGVLSVRLTLSAEPCGAFTYIFTVRTNDGRTIVLSPQEPQSGADLLFQAQLDPETNPTICVSAEVSVGGGNHVFDAAPNSGCLNLTLGGGFATSFN